MTGRPIPLHYRPAQIILHWGVVLGIIIQIALHEPIVRVVGALRSDRIPDAGDELFAWGHVTVGTAILLAVLARLYLRVRYGAPGHAPGTSPMQARMATIMHWSLYGLLFGMVITGMITWNGIAPLGFVHFYINAALVILVAGHAGAAIYNQFVRKDGTLRRMMLTRRTG